MSSPREDPCLDNHRLGELIDLIGTIVLIRTTSGKEIATAEGKVETSSHRSVDLLSRVYEYLLTRMSAVAFASIVTANLNRFPGFIQRADRFTISCVEAEFPRRLSPVASIHPKLPILAAVPGIDRALSRLRESRTAINCDPC